MSRYTDDEWRELLALCSTNSDYAEVYRLVAEQDLEGYVDSLEVESFRRKLWNINT